MHKREKIIITIVGIAICLMAVWTGMTRDNTKQDPVRNNTKNKQDRNVQKEAKESIQTVALGAAQLSESEEVAMESVVQQQDTESVDVLEQEPVMPEPVMDFCPSVITEEIFARISGLSYKKDCTVPKEELRYIRVLYYDFDGAVQEGELIVNAAIAEDAANVFRELYEICYPIEKIRLVDEYGADDNRSMADNNTSAFNFRTIDGTNKLSNHAQGFAIDINPLYNPYVRTKNGVRQVLPENAVEYADRTENNPYYIKQGDACYQIFKKYGFSWGGAWENAKDYQHFEKTAP